MPRSRPTQRIESGKPYTVVEGDTLWDICDREYGDPFHWQYVANYADNNERLEGNPHLIYPKMVIILPPADSLTKPPSMAPKAIQSQRKPLGMEKPKAKKLPPQPQEPGIKDPFNYAVEVEIPLTSRIVTPHLIFEAKFIAKLIYDNQSQTTVQINVNEMKTQIEHETSLWKTKGNDGKSKVDLLSLEVTKSLEANWSSVFDHEAKVKLNLNAIGFPVKDANLILFGWNVDSDDLETHANAKSGQKAWTQSVPLVFLAGVEYKTNEVYIGPGLTATLPEGFVLQREIEIRYFPGVAFWTYVFGQAKKLTTRGIQFVKKLIQVGGRLLRVLSAIAVLPFVWIPLVAGALTFGFVAGFAAILKKIEDEAEQTAACSYYSVIFARTVYSLDGQDPNKVFSLSSSDWLTDDQNLKNEVYVKARADAISQASQYAKTVAPKTAFPKHEQLEMYRDHLIQKLLNKPEEKLTWEDYNTGAISLHKQVFHDAQKVN